MQDRAFESIGTLASLAVALLALGVAPAPASGEPSPRADPTIRPNAAPIQYEKVIVLPLVIGYTREFLSNARLERQRIQGDDVLHMQRHYKELVERELGSVCAIVEQPGPSVLLVESILIDHALDKSDWLHPTTVAFAGAPRVRLVAFLRDSRTGSLLDSVGLLLKPRGDRMMRRDPGSYWHFMRSVFDRLATRVRWKLEDDATLASREGAR